MYTVKIIPSYSVVVMYVRMYVCLLQNLYIQLLLMNGIFNTETFNFNRHLGNIRMSFDSSLQKLLPF